MKTLSVRDLSSKGASSAVAAAEKEPVLITKHGEPAVWMVASRKLAALVAERGGDQDVYPRALGLIAVDLFDREVLSLGQASRLAGMALSDFIDLCSRLKVPVLREPEGGFKAELAAAKVWLGSGQEQESPDLQPVPLPEGHVGRASGSVQLSGQGAELMMEGAA